MSGMQVAPATAPVFRDAAPERRVEQRRVFHLLDSLNVGVTETQAVELALRMASADYATTMGCLHAQGPLLDKLKGSPVQVREFRPRGGLDSPGGVYQLGRLAAFLRRERFHVV